MKTDVDYVVVGASLAGISAALKLAGRSDRVLLLDFDRDTDSLADVALILATPLAPPLNGVDFEHVAGRILTQAGIERRSDCHITKVYSDRETVVECADRRWSCRGVAFAPNGSEPGLALEGSSDLQGFGVSYSAAADAPFFASRRVGVYGDVPRALEHARVAMQFASEVIVLAKECVDERQRLLLSELRPSLVIYEDVVLRALRSSEGGSLCGVEVEHSSGPQTIELTALFVAQHLVPDMTVIHAEGQTDAIVVAGLAAGVPYWEHALLVDDGERAAREILAGRA